MPARYFLDPAYEEALLDDLEARTRRFQQIRGDTESARRLSEHANRYPYAQTGVLESMARTGIEADSTEAEMLAAMSGEFMGRQGELASTNEANGSWWRGALDVAGSVASPVGRALNEVAGFIAEPFQSRPIKAGVRGAMTGIHGIAHEAVSRPLTAVTESGLASHEAITDPFRDIGEFARTGDVGAFRDVEGDAVVSQEARRAQRVWRTQPDSPMTIAFQKLRRGEPVDLGEGFMPGGDIYETYRTTALEREVEDGISAVDYYGGDVSPGRSFTSAMVPDEVAAPGDLAYNTISGLIDFTLAAKFDPSAKVARVAGAARKGARTFGTSAVDEAVRELRPSLIEAPRKTAAGDDAFRWLTNNRVGQAVADDMLAETSPTEVWRKLNRRVPVEYANRIAKNTDNRDQLMQDLGELLGTHVREVPTGSWMGRGLARMGGSEYQAYGLGKAMQHRFADGARSRGLRKGRHNRLWWNEFPRHTRVQLEEPDQAMPVLENWMKNANVASDKITARLDELSEVTTMDFGARRSETWRVLKRAAQDVDEEIARGLGLRRGKEKPFGVNQHGQPITVKSRLTKLIDDADEELRQYALDSIGDPMYFPGAKLRANIDGTHYVTPTAHIFPEFLNQAIDLPDPRGLRRETSGVLDVLDRVKLRRPAEVSAMMLDPVTKGWKFMQLARAAWAMRVLPEEQGRMATSGLASAFRHPMEFFNWVGKYGKLGPGGDLTKAFDEFGQAMSRPEHWIDVGGKKVPQAVATGNYRRARPDDPDFVRGWADELSQLARDEVAQRVAGGLKAGDSHPNLSLRGMDAVEDWLYNGDGFEHLKRMERGAFDPDRGGVLTESFDNARQYLNSIEARIHAKAGGQVELRGANGQRIDVRRTSPEELAGARYEIITPGDPEIIRGIAEGRVGNVSMFPDEGWSTKMRDDLMGEVQRLADEGRNPGWVKVSQGLDDKGVLGNRMSLGERLDGVANHVFRALMGEPTDKLARSPAFKQHLWDEGERLMYQSTKEVQQQVFDAARGRSVTAEAMGEELGQQVPTSTLRRMKRILDDPNIAGDAIDDVDDLQQISKAYALNETKRLLYDLSKRGQAADVLRHTAPFFEAYKEIMTTWPRLIANNPAAMVRAGRVAQSGFFDTNPFGEEQFAYPAGDMPGLFGGITGAVGGALFGGVAGPAGRVAGAALGAGAGAALGTAADPGEDVPGQIDMVGRAEGVNLALQTSFVPGFGPLIQMPAGAIMKNKPGFQDLYDVVLPYGPSGASDIGLFESQLPAWAKRSLNAFRDDPETDTVYGNAVMRMATRLYGTGEYTNENGMLGIEGRQRLMEDANRHARFHELLRAFAQTTVPTGPQLKYSADTPEGLVAFDALKGELGNMFEETGDWDEAQARWIERFGPKNVLLLQRSTRTVNERATDESGAAWERAHGDLVSKYRPVIGFFAPSDPDADLDFAAYRNAKESGDIEHMTPEDRTALHNHMVGKAAMAAERDRIEAMGRADDPGAQRYLSDYKRWLRETYPGYDSTLATMPVREKPEKLIGMMNEAVQEPELQDTEVAQGWREYMGARQQAIDQLQGLGVKTFKAKSSAHLSAYLRDMGTYLSQQYDGFAPVFDGILGRELLDWQEIEEKTGGAITQQPQQ